MARKLIALVGNFWPGALAFTQFLNEDSRFDTVHVSSVADLREHSPNIVIFAFTFLFHYQWLYDIYKWCQDSKVVTVLWLNEAIILKPESFDWTFSHYPTNQRNMSVMALEFKFAVIYPDVAKKYNCWGLRNEPKTNFCYFLQGNHHALERIEFVEKLMLYKRVDCMGSSLNNMPRLIPYTDGFSDLKILKDYKFGIAFENHSSDYYTTEKIFRSYLAGSVPIYWGDRKVADQINPAAFINCHDFANFDEVIAHVKEVDNDPDLYQSYVNAPLFLPNSPVLQNGREQLYQRFGEIIASSDKIHPISARRFYLLKVKVFYHLNIEYRKNRIYHESAFDHRIFYYGFLPYVVMSAGYFRNLKLWQIYKFVFGRWPKLDRTLTPVMRKIYRLVKKRRA